jgi:aspartyl-tRNA(Asn)/glutamyl-tRNA(Gln) amidotransferase subunit C
MDLDSVRKVAKLARLDLNETDLVKMTEQLSAIFHYVEKLNELDTEGVEPMAHPLPVQNVFREDEPRPSLTPNEALANAPNRLGDFFGVPAVLDGGDEGH